MDRWLPRKNQISMVEMFGAVLAVFTFKACLRGKRVILFVDSEAVEGALVKGYSCKEDICELTGIFWELVAEYEMVVYIDRVSTDANIADKPSRGDMAIATRCGWEVVAAEWPRVGPGST